MKYSNVFLGSTLSILCRLSLASSPPIVDLGYAIHQATLNVSSQLLRLHLNLTRTSPQERRITTSPTFDTQSHPSALDDSLPLFLLVAATQLSMMVEMASFLHKPLQVRLVPFYKYRFATLFTAWVGIAVPFVSAYLTGQNISEFTNQTTAYALLSNLSAPAPDPNASEDCLFLDVIVPEKIFNTISDNNGEVDSGAPILVWIYGGGYTEGSKLSAGNPASLIARSQLNGSEGVIFVAMNYRLGLFVSPCLIPRDNIQHLLGLALWKRGCYFQRWSSRSKIGS